jgi:hypothetical protein
MVLWRPERNIVSMFIQFSNILTNPRPLQVGAVARSLNVKSLRMQNRTSGMFIRARH